MIRIIRENKRYKVQIEKLAGEYWIEFIEKSTGLAQILYAKRKSVALGIYKNMDIDQIKASVDKMKLEKVKLYKAYP